MPAPRSFATRAWGLSNPSWGPPLQRIEKVARSKLKRTPLGAVSGRRHLAGAAAAR
jgi:hypothetical protein